MKSSSTRFLSIGFVVFFTAFYSQFTPSKQVDQELLSPDISLMLADQDVVINEILSNPGEVGDANGDQVTESGNDEFIEILNTGCDPIDISGWTLSDDDGDNFSFPDETILMPGEIAVLFGGGLPMGFPSDLQVFIDDGSIGNGLSNSNEVVELRDDMGILIDSYAYGTGTGNSAVNNESTTRDPGGTGEFRPHSEAIGSAGAIFSPGTLNDGSNFTSSCDPDLCQIILQESFETDGAGDRYTVTEFNNSSGDFFTRGDDNDFPGTYDVFSPDGSFYFAAMDTDGEDVGGSTVTFEIEDIDISNFQNLQFRGLFAEDDASDGNEDWDENDKVEVEVQIDGGGFEKILVFEAEGSTNTQPAQDTNDDEFGDGPPLTDVFTEFIADISGTGLILNLKITITGLTAGDEDIAFDNLIICGEEVDEPPVVKIDCDESPSIVISEIMFNPESGEDDWEWVELYNAGNSGVNLADFIIDDNNSSAFPSANINSGFIGPGQTAILFNGQDIDAADFTAAWGSGMNLISVDPWPSLNNGGNPADVIGLWTDFADYDGDNESQSNALLSVAYNGNTGDGKGSIYLTDLNDQSSFALSTLALNTPTGTVVSSSMVNGNSGGDLGSPLSGFIDASAPQICGFNTDGQDCVEVDADLVIFFNEAITKVTCEEVEGVLNVELYKVMDGEGELISAIDICGEDITIDMNQVIIDLPMDLEPDMEYYILIDGGSIEDLNANTFIGISDTDCWSFTTCPPLCETEAFFEPFDNLDAFSTTTPFFTDNGGDYLGLTDGSAVVDFGGSPILPNDLDVFSGLTNNYLIGEDLDGEGANLPIEIEWKDIVIDGLTDLNFFGDFAASEGIDMENDSLAILYRIDGGPYQRLALFKWDKDAGSNFNTFFREDTDFDGEGDGEILTTEAKMLKWPIPTTGTLLDIKLALWLNAGGESFAVDNFQVCGSGEIIPFDFIPKVAAISPDTGCLGFVIDPTIDLMYEFSEEVGPLDENVALVAQVEYFDAAGMSTNAIEIFSDDSGFDGTKLNINVPTNIPRVAVTLISDNLLDMDETPTELDGDCDGVAGGSVTYIYEFSGPIEIPYMAMFDECESALCAGWTPISVDIDPRTWTCGSGVFSIDASDGGNSNLASEDWLISPVFNLNASSNEVLSFDLEVDDIDENTDFPQLTVSYTNNYTGDPNTTNWIPINGIVFPEISDGLPANSFSGYIEIDSIQGDEVRFGFQYLASGTGSNRASAWSIDNFFIKEIAATVITDPLVCIDDEVKFAVEVFGGTAPYQLTIRSLQAAEDFVFNLDEKKDTVSIPMPAGVNTIVNSNLNFLFVSLTDSQEKITTSNSLLTIQARNCGELINDFKPTDPCACNEDQSANGAQDGTFMETISINDTLSDEKWTVIAATAAAGGVTTPTLKVGGPIVSGAELGYNLEDQRYFLEIEHTDDSGYEIIVEGPNPQGSINNRVLKLSNVCAYPVISFDPGIPSGLPKNAVPIIFDVNEENDFPEDENQPARFEVNNAEAIQLNPLEVNSGDYTIKAFFKADTTFVTGGTIAMPGGPGCMTTISTDLNIRTSFINSDSCRCISEVNVNLSENCEYDLQLSQVVTGDDCVGMRVQVADEVPSNGSMIDCAGTFSYGVFDGADNLFCWGTINVEDKIGPYPSDTIPPARAESYEFDCAQIRFILNNELSIQPTIKDFFGNVFENRYYMGEILFEDACKDCGCEIVERTFSDVISYYDCDRINEDRTYAEIKRTWTAKDCNGDLARATQLFRVYVPDIEDLFLRNDRIIQACDLDTVNLKSPDIPFWLNDFGAVTLLNQVDCNYSLSVDESDQIELCEGSSFQFFRYYFLNDWCTGETIALDTVLVKVGDFQAPEMDSCLFTEKEYSNLFPDQSLRDYSLSNPQQILDDLNDNNIDAEFLENFAANPILDENDEAVLADICILQMASTGPMDCTAAINTDLDGLRAFFGINIVEDCQDPSISSEIISYSEIIVGGFPTGEYAWQIGGYSMVGTMAVGIPEGLHAIIIQAADNCFNDAIGIIFFTVMDGTKPVLKCDDELRVTLVDGDPKLQIQGYALATAQDVDEGSWDNCGPVDLHVRRIINDADVQADWEAKNGHLLIDEYEEEDPDYNQGYTGWDDLVEFFCGDLDEKVTVELRGSDSKKIWRKCIDKCGGSTSDDVYIYSMFRKTQEQQDDGWVHVKTPNQSVCWLEVEVENGTNYTVELDGGGTALCTDDFNADDFITVTYLGLQCASPDIEVVVEPELDQCGIGRYKIYLQDNTDVESKNRPNVDPNPVYVYVRPYHDYWIKFPKDAIYDCGADQEVGGVETSADLEVGCDLLAISTLPDERFAATSDPDACYKIFRTYRVINWCEYDGQQEPVVVSRDWDSWNGFDFGTSTTSDDRDPNARREYNINPQFPDGDDNPGNTDLYVIVKRNLNDDLVDRVFYDADSDPTANVGEVSTDQPRFGSNGSGNTDVETYWWQVTSGSRGIVDLAPAGNSSNDYFGDTEANEPDWDLDTNNESYYDGSYRGQPVRWGYDPNVSNADPNGSANDSSDNDDDDQYYGSVGFWQYTQHIIVYDDTAPEVRVEAEETCSINGETCDAETSFDIVITDVCSLDDITLKVYVNGEAASDVALNATDTAVIATVTGRRGLGNYKISGEVNDGCGNITPFDGELEVVDCKAPAPICHEDLVVELMPADAGGQQGDVIDPQASVGMNIVWADDLIASPVGDCSGQGPEEVLVGNDQYLPMIKKYSINRVDSAVVDSLTSLVVTCTDEGQMIDVEIHAWDELGNHDFCRTSIIVQDNNGICNLSGATGEIAGVIETEQAAKLEGVEVQLSGAQSRMYMTGQLGDYGFNNLTEGHDFSVIPTKDNDHKNGVSTFDLILIQKHILGVATLDSPYQLIAADANNSKSVSTLDLIQIRKLILNIDTEFANNTSWRFVDADYTFPNEHNPWQASFPEIRNINNLEGEQIANFIAVKVGDVNGSANVEARAKQGVFAINTAEQAMIAGNEYTIEFTADLAKVAGYQFTLDVKQAEIVDIIYGAASAEHFGVFTKQGIITTSFNGEALTENASETLFSIVVRANADVKLSEAIGISSRYTAAEAYTDLSSQHKLLGVALNFEGLSEASGEFVLNQNTPNPFQGETVIGFNLPQAAEATITLKDVAGRTIKVIEGDFTKGYNQVRVKSNELPATGVFFYTLTVGELTATKKMIITE